MELLESRAAQEFADALSAQPGVASQPTIILHSVIEQHCVRFSHRVVAEPAELERIVRARITKMQSVSQLVQEGVVVALATVRTKHQVDLLRDPHRRAERTRAFSFALTAT